VSNESTRPGAPLTRSDQVTIVTVAIVVLVVTAVLVLVLF